ncbi:hypothetical protein ACHHYP_13689 [Achlya hypogyna]|uniref:Uncharacterized protein n=1 Tax=Achlya hypogyna TaxID=1202772 RepID=A0A1V9YEP9_ACHHY|nr:hypothetical protein ACHHYP_13689 [Achlya hypogyna]
MAPSQTTPFQPKHALVYDLELGSTGPSGDQTVRCNFCAFEGRDKVELVLDLCRERISSIWSDKDIDNNEADQRELYAAYNGGDAFLKAAIDKHDLSTTLDEAWDVTSVRLLDPHVWEMDENRTDTMHLSLEGIFQAKQRNKLSFLMH